MQILDHRQINQKIKRLAIEIVEQHYREPEIILAGINNNGFHFGKLLQKELEALNKVNTVLTRIRLSPADPLSKDIEIDYPVQDLKDKVIVIIDDVANTGRTIFYACKPIFQVVPKRLEVAVLVDRTHKSFPIRVDYVGLSLATTLKEEISVKIRDVDEFEVTLN